jgi:hypothetical protein
MRTTDMVSEAAATAAGGAMAALAALRRAKAVHPHGVVHSARLHVPGAPAAPTGSTLLSQPGDHDAIVRFSRSIGLPRALPDLLGLSLRVIDAYGPDRHQDFLMVTSVDAPILHHVFLPAYDVRARPYSSSLPYRAGGERFIVGAVPRPRGTFDLAVAALEGRFAPVGEIRIGAQLPEEADAIPFNPFNTGGGLEPVGLLNQLRRKAYPMSQRAWSST